MLIRVISIFLAVQLGASIGFGSSLSGRASMAPQTLECLTGDFLVIVGPSSGDQAVVFVNNYKEGTFTQYQAQVLVEVTNDQELPDHWVYKVDSQDQPLDLVLVHDKNSGNILGSIATVTDEKESLRSLDLVCTASPAVSYASL